MKDLVAVRQAIAEVLSPGCFYARLPSRLEWEHLPADETPWEVSSRLSPCPPPQSGHGHV